MHGVAAAQAPKPVADTPAGSASSLDMQRNLPPIRYALESIQVRGNNKTLSSVVRGFVGLERGDILDVEDSRIEAIRWTLLGTGWFRDVKLRLERGSERGWVVLVIEVRERNTLVIQQLGAGLSEGVSTSEDTTADLEPYAGVELAETNFLGRGQTLSLATVVSAPQQGIRMRFQDPFFMHSAYALRLEGMFNHARDFFGDDDTRVSIACPADESPENCPEEVLAKNAVVLYRRYGVSVGSGRALGQSTQLTLDWHGEVVDVPVMPDAASEQRGSRTVPIDFSIEEGLSRLSMLQFGLVYDRRDEPNLTTSGWLLNFRTDVGGAIVGSDYDFLRLQLLMRHWEPLAPKHVIRFGAFMGVIFGRAPFFYRFYASDLSDLIPSRMLELNLDRRPPPNLFKHLGVENGTAVQEMRSEEAAGRLDVEYAFALRRSATGIYAIDAYLGAGVYALTDLNELRVAIPGYEGFSQYPIDLTFDLGIRMDTDVGLFQIGFSNIIGFVAP